MRPGPILLVVAITLGAALVAPSAFGAGHHAHATTDAAPPATGTVAVADAPVRHVGVVRPRLLFVGAQLGPSYSFYCCGGSPYGGFGFWGNAYIGLTFTSGLSLAIVLGANVNFYSNTTYGDFTGGVRARYAFVHDRRFRPFLQVQIEAHGSNSTDVLIGTGPGAGFEFDFSRRFSGEVGVKTDLIFPLGATSRNYGVGFAMLPFIGFNFFR